MSSSILRPKGKSPQEIASHQEEKAYVDFVYQTNQTLQSHSQGLIGLSLSYEKKVAMFLSDLKATQIQFENLEKKVNAMVEGHCSIINLKVSDMLALVEDIHDKTEDIYDNFASLEDMAGVQLALEAKCDEVRKYAQISNAANESSLFLAKGHLQAQIDDLRHLVNQPDLGHQQCEISLQIKRDEDAVTIKGLQIEIERLKKQCDYNQKQFEYVVEQIKRQME